MSTLQVPSGAPSEPLWGAPAENPSATAEEAEDGHSAYLEALKEMGGHPTMKLDLAEIEQVAQALGGPHRKFAAIHVAGTNGKGSVCSKVAACLMAKGLRVGVFSSPHLLSLRERFIVNGDPVSEAQFAESHKRVIEAAKAVGATLTFFECCTLIAFDIFASVGVEWAIVETGLGGRLDATNILRETKCCVITSIGWDHTDVLGNSLEAIAAEKAGIFKPKARVVLGPSAASLGVLWERAAALECDVWEAKAEPRGEDFDQENSRVASSAVSIHYVLSLDLTPPQLAAALATRPPLRGQALSQQQLSLAANLCSTSSSKGGAAAAGAETAADAKKLPVGVIVDVGHNVTAVNRLLQTVGHQHYGCPVRAVVCLSHNRSPELLLPFLAHLAFPQNNRLKCLHLASANHQRGREASEVFQEICASPRYSESLPVVETGVRESIRMISDNEDDGTVSAPVDELIKRLSKGTLPRLLRAAFAAAAAEGSLLVVCGSFFMMREVMQTFGLDEGPIDPVDMNEQSPTKPETNA